MGTERTPITALLGAFMALFLPGYALGAALFPPGYLGRSERIMVALGLSLALSILGGLVLNLSPLGLGETSWLALLGSVTLVASAVGILRRATRPLEEAGEARLSPRLSSRQLAVLGLAALLAVTAVGVTAWGEALEPKASFTQLWLLPPQLSGGQQVTLGVRNMEQRPMSYRLDLSVNGQVVREWVPLLLHPGETWEERSTLPESANQQPVEALLYLLEEPDQVYRRVTLAERRPAL
jgi:uncharacterized membrane protein